MDTIQDKIEELNAALGDVTPFKLALVNPSDVIPAVKNARFMTQSQMKQLTENIRKDGNLSTMPFCWRDEAGKFHIIGGHHRMQAAAAAKVPSVLVVYTDKEMSEAERIARQLGDNAITGQDDPQVLAELYTDIRDLEWKEYSGLDDETLNYKPEVPGLGAGGNLRLEPVTFMLFNEEIELMDDLIRDVKKAPNHKYYGSYDDVWESFFEALLDYGFKRDVVSASTTLIVLTKLARAALKFDSDVEFLESLATVSEISGV